jgi:FkbM family methyltransferase
MSGLLDLGKRSYLAWRLLGTLSASKLVLMNVLLPRAHETLTRIRLADIPSEFWLRPKGSDLDVILQIFSARDYDLNWCVPYKHHVEQLCAQIRSEGNVPLIIDGGANIGASTIWFATNFAGCQVFGIEPERQNFAVLSRNTTGYSNITLFNAALWDRPEPLSLVLEEGTGWGCRVKERAHDKSIVPTVTVPDLLSRDAKLRPVIVKVDIEGAEAALLRSATEWVDDVPLMIFEQHDNNWEWLGTWQGTGHAFFSVLARRKREYLFRGENVMAFLHPDHDIGEHEQADRADVQVV